MNWYGTAGDGTQTPAGTRASDPDSMCGNAVMYEAVAGNILTLGGSPDYTGKSTRISMMKDCRTTMIRSQHPIAAQCGKCTSYRTFLILTRPQNCPRNKVLALHETY